MNIIIVSKRGTIKLPKEFLNELHGAKHLLIKSTATGLSLTPVQIQAAIDIRSIPSPQAKKTT